MPLLASSRHLIVGPMSATAALSAAAVAEFAMAAIGIMLVAFAEGLAAAKTYAAKFHYERRCQPRARCHGGGEPRLGALEWDGRRRERLQDRSERFGRCQHAALGAVRGRVHDPDAAVFDRPIRGPARRDARCGGDRRSAWADRRAVLRRYYGLAQARSDAYQTSPPVRTSSPR